LGTTILTRKSETIRTLVAALAVPFPPISTCAAYLTVPGATILNDIFPAEGIPVHLATFLASIVLEELPEWNCFTSTRQFVLFRQIFFREGCVLFNVLDGADGQGIHVHAVQRVVAIRTGAVFITRLIILETRTAFV